VEVTQPRLKEEKIDVAQTNREISYTSYNHNNAQRRRKAKHNRRHRNPISSPDVTENISPNETFSSPPASNPTDSQPETQGTIIHHQSNENLLQETEEKHPKVQFNDNPEIIPTSISSRRSARGRGRSSVLIPGLIK